MKLIKINDHDLAQSFWILVLIILSGGLQDSYSYFFRGGVFANAQTGNVILMSVNLFEGNFSIAVTYLLPIIAFVLGIIVAKTVKHFLEDKKFYWKQCILLIEAALLLGVCFIPEKLNWLANALVSFSCAMQVITFDKIYGNNFATTMCVGNLVKMSDSFIKSIINKDKELLKRSGIYLLVIIIFAIGAGCGYLLEKVLGTYTICVSSGLILIASFGFMLNDAKQPKERG